jgi:hypothetical protein
VGRRPFRALGAAILLIGAPLALTSLTASEAGAVDANNDASFRAAFITPGPVTINVTASFTLACTGAVTRSDAGAVTIVGNGFTIDTCNTQAMLIQNGTGDVNLQGLTLSGSIAAVSSTSSGNVALTNSEIASVSNAGGSSSGITTDSGNITLVNSTVTGTHSSTVAIALGTSSGNVSLDNSLVSKTSGITTFGISASSTGNISLVGSSVQDTEGTTGTAQAILAIGTGNATLTASTVSNTSGSNALAVGAGGSATLTDSAVSVTHSTNGNALAAVSNNGAVTLINSELFDTHADGNNDAFGAVGGSDAQLTDSQVIGTTSESGNAFGVSSEASTSLTRSTVTSTRTNGLSLAVGVFAEDDVVMNDSSVLQTTSPEDAFGVLADASTTLVRSTIARTSGAGIGIGVLSSTSTTLTNSTITDNAGYAILTGTNAVLVYSDIVRNGSIIGEASVSVAAIDVELPGGLGTFTSPSVHVDAAVIPGQINAGGTITSFASVLTLPQFGFVNCQSTGAKITNGYNFADDTSCGFTGTGDRQGVGLDAQLGLLADNGGPTLTLLPATTSPLVDGVPAAACKADGAAGVTTDQRSLTRPGTGTTACDIGSVELQFAVPSPVVIIPAFTG